jgi:hypothetical protein
LSDLIESLGIRDLCEGIFLHFYMKCPFYPVAI